MKRRVFSIVMCGFVIATLFCCVSCDNKLDIQQAYPFTVETMPVQTKIVKGETTEIRCELKRKGCMTERLIPFGFFSLPVKAPSSLMTVPCSNPTTVIRWIRGYSDFIIPLRQRINKR